MEFELAQSEIHAETLRVLQQRFEKEKRYWENLTSSKDDILPRQEQIPLLPAEVRSRQEAA